MKRRDFIKKSASASAAASTIPFLLNGLTVHAYAHSPIIAALAGLVQTNRVLVVVQLDGGNDGLNTVIPIENALYYNKRPTLGIKKSDALKMNGTLGWHPIMTGFDTLFKEGKIALIQNVGYKNPNRSHFRSIDIWFTGSDEDQVLDTGWIGRYLDYRYPNYPANAPSSPLAIQIGNTLSLTFQGPNVGMGMALYDVEAFYRLIDGTDTSLLEEPPNTRAGDELRYIRHIAVEAQSYAKPIRETFNASTNKATYPTNYLADQLKIVARLISGTYNGKQLETPVYLVRIGGFDTHANQITSGPLAGYHQDLLGNLSGSIAAFLQDCKLLGVDDRVLVTTISEFGRRVNENGTLGTDHGTCAPHFVIGNAVNGGVYGHDPDLSNLDYNQDLIYQYDFRQIYSSILEQWFGVKHSDVSQLFSPRDTGVLTPLPIINAPTGINNRAAAAEGYSLEQNYPNPFSAVTSGNPSTKIRFTVKGGGVRLRVFDSRGRGITTLVDGTLPAGNHEVIFNANNLSVGTYFYRLEANGFTETKSMIFVR